VPGQAPAALEALRAWATARGDAPLAQRCERYAAATPLGATVELPGPTGERNTLSWHARGRVLFLARDATTLLAQLAAALATGNAPVIAGAEPHAALLAGLPPPVRSLVATIADWRDAQVALVLHDAGTPALAEVRRHFAAQPGARVRVLTADAASDVELAWLLAERVVSVNTAAAGGNASLMTLAPDA
jgi:RHH-type proline utilization regulon transcriptional repressor/proline dehydrogenase/delta 1-pyrroline-5-carboxylate dehydrogenase